MMVEKVVFKIILLWALIKNQVRVFIYNLRPGVYIGRGVKISRTVLKVRPGGKINIGRNSVLEGTIIDSSSECIAIGEYCNLQSCNLKVKFGGSVEIGNHSEIMEGSIIHTYGGEIIIGDNCSINANTIIYGHGNTHIGHEVLIAGHCMIIPSNHVTDKISKSIRLQGNRSKGIEIKNNVWMGHASSVLDGVIVGEGSVIGAGAVVAKNTKKNGIYMGVPATLKRIRS
ncbi:MAG: hypothetical protein ACFHWX_17055 [Bacteroidota bacterium]